MQNATQAVAAQATQATPAKATKATKATKAAPVGKTVTVQMVTLTGKTAMFRGARQAYWAWCQANIGKGMQLNQLVHIWGLQATNPSCVAGTAPRTGIYANMPEPPAGWLNFLQGRKKASPVALLQVMPVQVPIAQVWAPPKA